MLELRVFGERPAMDALVQRLSRLPGTGHITHGPTGDGDGRVVVTADVDPAVADEALGAAFSLGVAVADVALLRLDAVQPGQRPGSALVWADLVGQASAYTRPVARYLVLMLAAGVIAAYGVIYSNSILIVGAMAVSPDLRPITATCIGLALRRLPLVHKAFWTLLTGLAAAGLAAYLLTGTLNLAGLLPSAFTADSGVISGLTTVNTSTVLVALVAGVAAMLAAETRASSAVGVAISVTTIPASAYIGVAAGAGEHGKASGALAVLSINVVCLIAAGTLTLAVQRSLQARADPQPDARAS